MTDPNDKPSKTPTDQPSDQPGDTPAAGAPLRGQIDAGRGRDKVAYPDPAAAPLGTDDEAAGTPITEEQLEMARAQEDRTDQVPKTDEDRTAGATGAISVTGADRITAAETDPAERSKAKSGMGGVALTVISLIILLVVILFVFSPI